MSKQVIKKLEDKYVGSLGLRFDRTFPDESTSRNSSLNAEAKEMVKQVRWWGESYGYFHRKSDAAIFAGELEQLIATGVLQFGKNASERMLQKDTSNKWFIDPETAEPKQTNQATRTLSLEALGQFPLAKYKQGLHLPMEAQTAVIAVHSPELEDLSGAERVYAGRVAAVASNIIILMSGYSARQEAEATNTHRPITFVYSQDSRSLEFELGAITASSELAKLHSKNTTEAIEMPEIILEKQDQKLLDYGLHMLESYGVYNNLIFGFDPDYKVVAMQAPKPAAVKAQAVRPAPQEQPKVNAPVVQQSEPQQPAEQLELVQTGPALNSLAHRFMMQKAECLVLVEFNSSKPVGILITAHKVSPLTVNYLNTLSAFASKLLQNGVLLTEVGDSLTGIIFEPNTNESSSILDYVGNWLKTLHSA